jgi:hypothetical protein
MRIVNILKLIFGFSSLFILICFRFNYIPDIFIDQSIEMEEKIGIYGDLYYLCRVDIFKTKLDSFVKENKINYNNTNIEDAETLIFGDSFFDDRRGIQNIPELLSDSLNRKIFYRNEAFPLSIISKKYNSNKKEKILIYEATERRVSNDFNKQHTYSANNYQNVANVLKFIEPYDIENKYQFLLSRSVISSRLYSNLTNLKFSLFGLISDLTPVYLETQPWLFYFQEVNGKNTSFYYQHTQLEIDNIANNIQSLSLNLKEKNNIDFIFVMIPNKYTLYHNILNNDTYNNFIPRLQNELKKRTVSYIDIYELFKKSKEILYYPTDTHFNKKGKVLVFYALKKRLLEIENNKLTH